MSKVPCHVDVLGSGEEALHIRCQLSTWTLFYMKNLVIVSQTVFALRR